MLAERVVIALRYILPRCLLNGSHMTIQPETVERPACFKIVTINPYRMPEDAPIPVRTASALPILREIYAARIGAKHIVSILDPRLHMVV